MPSLPNATLQQSRALTPSPGSKHATGASRCRTSHTRTAPSRPSRRDTRHQVDGLEFMVCGWWQCVVVYGVWSMGFMVYGL